MAVIVELPRLSDTMEEGVVAKWRVAVGDRVKRGQVIAEIETDKATMEFESFDAGEVLQLVADEGSTLPLGAPIAVLGKKGEDPGEALAAFTPPDSAAESKPAAEPQVAAPATAPAPSPSPVPAAANTPVVVDPSDKRIPASPVARKLAREAGIPLSAIAGSGPHGRVVKADVEQAAASGGSVGAAVGFSADADQFGRPYARRADTSIAHTQMRKTIVKRMVESKTTVPHFYLTVDIDMQRAAKMRGEYNAALDGKGKISFNDLLILASARALIDHPEVNVTYTKDGAVRHGDVHMGVAVAVEGGLIVPVVRHAEQKTLAAIAAEVKDLARRAQERALKPDEMSGSTFSVSNLGMFGIQEFSAVINPGEGGILAVGAVEDRAVVVDGELTVRKRMKMTMSCDHRVVDGAVGAIFLKTVRGYLENPMKLFT